ncbi:MULTISPECIES: LysE family translocator [Bordetella]|uniref:Lysine transporter LysE n=2 Tax=Bordetella TaxID=517 RepID=A0A261VZ55_9BORD|nr:MULTISPECIES: LysE family translocator [Bordetella]MDM9560443.1 LysE family translocator [Bordetella petrii]OZI78900.1 lysine transporter LysE [Bordetella genomosp. 2]
MDTQTLLAFVLVAALNIMSPGPAVLLAMRNGASGGWRAVVPSTLGNITGLFLLSAAAMLGLGVLLQTSALAFAMVKVAGACYLIYMGLRHLAGRVRLAPPEPAAATPRSPLRLYAEALLVAGLNPKPILFFSAFFPQFLDTARPLLPQFFVLTGLFMAISCASLLLYGGLARQARGLLRRPTVVLWLNRAIGAAFVSFGLALLRLRRAAN